MVASSHIRVALTNCCPQKATTLVRIQLHITVATEYSLVLPSTLVLDSSEHCNRDLKRGDRRVNYCGFQGGSICTTFHNYQASCNITVT